MPSPEEQHDPDARRGESPQVSLPPLQFSVHHHAPYGQRIRHPSPPSRLQPRRYGKLPEQRPSDWHPGQDGRRICYQKDTYSFCVAATPKSPKIETQKELTTENQSVSSFLGASGGS